MNLTRYNFPKLTSVDLAFSTVKTDPALLEEAKQRGFYNTDTEWNDLFSQLFYKGGMPHYRNDIDKVLFNQMRNYMIALMRSFEPRHEEKEAVCAMLLSELCEASK